MPETTTGDTTTTTTGDQTTETVSKQEFEHVMKDLHKFKQLAKDFEDKLKTKDLDSMKGSQKWEEIAKLKEQEAQDAQTELTDWKKTVMQDKKISIIREEALKQKIRQDALDDLDGFDFADLVQVEAVIGSNGTRKINVLGADRAVQYLKTKRSHWFQDLKAPNVNTNTPTVTTADGKVDVKQIMEAEKKAKESGDYAAYRGLVTQFNKQKQQARI